jgi:hypothetical protein
MVYKEYPSDAVQGCQTVSFETKNPDLGKFLESLRLENVYIFNGHLEYITDVWDIS